MDKLKFFSMMAMTAIVLSLATSCISDNGEPDVIDSQVELRLSSDIEVQTRAAFTGADTQIPSGRIVIVFVDDAGDSSPLYDNNELTADGSGGFTNGIPMFFPKNGHNVNIYAIHTLAMLPSDVFTDTIIHNVKADQRTLADYAPSDLLYARATDVARTPNAVPLTFYHLLSKLQVAIVVGGGLTAGDVTGVTVGGMKLEANFKIGKATAPNAVTVTAGGTATGITISSDVSTDLTAPQYNDAIIVPQTLAAGTAFISVHTSNGDLVYNLPGNVTFESGKKYVYQITAHLTGLTLTSSITDWTPINPVTGDAGM
jgi:hypothetical protein